jgi:hypothetical protein
MKKIRSRSVSFLRPVAGLALALGASAGLAGCDNQSEAPAANEGSLNEKVIGSADVGYGTVRFHEVKNLDGTTSVFLSEEASNVTVRTPLDLAIREGHTNLEMWQTLLPNEKAPATLSAMHALEASRLGRANDAVVAAHFHKDAPVEKSAKSCANWVYEDVADDMCTAYTWGNFRRIDNTSGDKALHVGQNWAFATTSNVTMGICNDSDVNVKGRIGVDVGGDGSDAYAFRGWATVKPGSKHRWFNFSTTANGSTCSPGDTGLCLSFPLPSRYRIEGSSPDGKVYHLKTGELQSNPSGNNSCSCIPC